MYILALFVQVAMATQPIVPKVSLDFWNGSDRVDGNNCYNYSTNRVTNSFAQPGEASGKMYEDLTCKDVLKAAAADEGLARTRFFKFNGKEDDSLIALVVSPGQDFHWYRRGDDGMWTHKPGSLNATDRDESDHTITDPEKADRGIYSDFCGYFRIKNYRYESHEQDGGFVKIGTMEELPEMPKESEVIVQMYSGRPNPRFKLRDLLNDPVVKAQFESLRDQMSAAPMSLMARQKAPSKLGYSGIKIIDREGLVFHKGTEVQVKGVDAFVQPKGESLSVRLPLQAPLNLERHYFQQFETR